MVHYKLTYFNGRGKAETIRLIFAIAEVKYEDVRIEWQEWCQKPELKSNTPFGQLPILEMDGKTFCQSDANGRYLARKFNLAGKTDLEQLEADMIVDCVEDGLRPYFTYFPEKDEARKAEMRKKYSEEQLPNAYSSLEKILKSNKGGDGFFVGDRPDVGGSHFTDAPLLGESGWPRDCPGQVSEVEGSAEARGKHAEGGCLDCQASCYRILSNCLTLGKA